MSETKKFGPYKGSKENGGRPIYVYKKKVGDKWVTTSKNKARADYESENGKLSKDTHVDHKDNNKKNDSKGNLRALKGSKNIAKENKRRAGKKENDK
ncbi:HNH nuclease [uncultured Caudovirales phage]|uniref:HNH nuclease n=1 Tax=uncultured Caudovirales phage TaxID=2100421 RepID=A0A6J5QY97_9CAUD|nr:HNH nuclease [uncultured Caudovirales phage]CAB4179905.1 HNH nuclease [uncultured Caudovirales phage]CAB4188732.1 HNH nuclease [uncultured Caudovirales phage]